MDENLEKVEEEVLKITENTDEEVLEDISEDEKAENTDEEISEGEEENSEPDFIEEISEELLENPGYRILNLFRDKDTTEYRTVKQLNNTPPTFIISDENGYYMTIQLTLENTLSLINDLQTVEKGFYGYKYANQSFKEKIKNLPKDIKYHPLPYIWFGLILFLIVLLYFLS